MNHYEKIKNGLVSKFESAMMIDEARALAEFNQAATPEFKCFVKMAQSQGVPTTVDELTRLYTQYEHSRSKHDASQRA